jgi:hypothetical protein
MPSSSPLENLNQLEGGLSLSEYAIRVGSFATIQPGQVFPRETQPQSPVVNRHLSNPQTGLSEETHNHQGRWIVLNTFSGEFFWDDNGFCLDREELSTVGLTNYCSPRRSSLTTRTEDTNYSRSVRSLWRESVVYDYATPLVEDDLEVVPTSHQPQYNGKWPIGTIVKWDITIDGIKEHVISQGIGLKNNFLKIVRYSSSGNLQECRYIGKCENTIFSYDTKYFVEASKKECALFEKTMAEMNQCTSRPPIGTVLEFLGHGSLNGKRCVVLEEKSDDGIYVKWLRIERASEKIKFCFFRISSSQEGSFVSSDRDYCSCKNCNLKLRVINPQVIKISTTERYCSRTCAQINGWVACASCNKYHQEAVLLRANDSQVCQNCLSTYYRPCNDCGGVFLISRMNISNSLTHIETSIFTCRSCIDCVRSLIHDHSYKPNYCFNKMAWENTRYLGIELEVEIKGSSDARLKMAEKIKTFLSQQEKVKDVLMRDGIVHKGRKLDRLIYMKSDGSLNNGIEIVFNPFTLKSFHKNFPLQVFLKFLAEHDALIKDNCGMHIHVSKDRLSDLDLVKGKWFFHKCESFLKTFSSRSRFDFCKFDPYPPTRDPYRQEYGHHSALNTHSRSEKTLEIRIFNATLDYHKFLANLQFADVFVDYIQHGAGAVFLQRENKNIIWQNFLEYAKSQNRYQVMTSWILQNRIV